MDTNSVESITNSKSDISASFVESTEGSKASSSALSNENYTSKENVSSDESIKAKMPSNIKMQKNRGKVEQQRPRIIPSRYKKAAAATALKGKMDVTIRGSPLSVSSPVKGIYTKRRTLAASIGDVSKLPNQMKLDGHRKSGSTNAPKKFNNQKLHSTALHQTVDFDKTSSAAGLFSTTVIGGSKCLRRSGEMTLPDISLSLFQASAKSEEYSGSCSSSGDPDLFKDADVSCITEDQLNLKYLQYLTWAFIDNKTEETHKKQVKSAKSQLSFLQTLIDQKYEEMLFYKRCIEVMKRFKELDKQYSKYSEVLSVLAGAAPEILSILQILGRNLQEKMSHIQLEGLYVPENAEDYSKRFLVALGGIFSVLEKLIKELNPTSEYFEKVENFFSLFDDTLKLHRMCSEQLDEVASLAIEESSLKLTLDSIEKNETETS